MKNIWDNREAKKLKNDLLALRVYTSRLLGASPNLVMHGGGNTSVKIKESNIFGEEEQLLYIKGSGWDLGTIEAAGFAPVKLDVLTKLAGLETLSDLDMVTNQRVAMTNPAAPNPSVEAILHAIIPFTFVDHTHADAVVTITNTPGGKKKIQEIYGKNMLIVPYVMPGFILAKKIFDMTHGIDWSQLDGMILLNHGVFTFDNDAKSSYDKMIAIVSKAERYIAKKQAGNIKGSSSTADPKHIAKIRKVVSEAWGKPVLAGPDKSALSVGFSNLKNVKKISTKGPITPDHVIRTKRCPVVLGKAIEKDIKEYAKDYLAYFKKFHEKGQKMLDPAPRWAILPGSGSIYFGPTMKHVEVIGDIARHTQLAIYNAEGMGGWKPLALAELFEMEYWSLEQAKLKKSGSSKPMEGKIALVTGAASGIGKACVMQLHQQGAVVAALDIDSSVLELADSGILPLVCDLTKESQLKKTIDTIVLTFGGIDMVVSNAGIFPPSAKIESMDKKLWDRSIQINLTSHQQLIQFTLPYLKIGFDPAVVIVGSKNVPAPGPGASAYSVAKAGLTQLARVAALELGADGIRVNIIHPNAVYDTAIWTDEVLKARAKNYGLSVREYKTNNVLKTEVTSRNVAELTVSMLGSTFSKVTGAQVPIDGGNDRVI